MAFATCLLLGTKLQGADAVLVLSGQLFLEQSGTRTRIAPELSGVSEVHASYDAKRLLVAAESASHSQIFQLNADGTGVRQITACVTDCRHGSFLPDGDIAFTVQAVQGSYVARIKTDGTGLERITFGPRDYDLQGVLPDGRLLILHERGLFGMRPDGTGLDSILCNHKRSSKLHPTAAVRAELVPQPRARRLWSTLKPELGQGHFIALDTRISSPDAGGELASAPASVRVWATDRDGNPCALGIAPVERDGSFYVAVPADKPIRFELLDDAGKSIREEKSWIWARSGEERGCVGCHAEKAIAPANHWPDTLKRFDTPTKLTGGNDAK